MYIKYEESPLSVVFSKHQKNVNYMAGGSRATRGMPDQDNGSADERSDLAVDLTDDETRRGLMKKAAGLGAAGLVGSAAGCTGGDGGSDGGGGSTKTVRLLMAPDSFMGIIFKEFQDDTNTFEQYYEDAGLNLEVAESWEGAAIFTAGGADFESFGSLEAAIIGGEREIPLACNADLVPVFLECYTQQGTPYDPAEHGGGDAGIAAAIDQQVEDQEPVGHNGWGGGTTPSGKMVYQSRWGYTWSEETDQTDIPTQVVQFFAMAKLLNQGELMLGINSPEHGMSPFMKSPTDLTSVFQLGAELEKEGFGIPQLNAWTSSQEFASEYPEAVEALVQGYQEGVDWLFSDPIGIIVGNEDRMDMLGMENEADVTFLVEWGIKLSDPGPWENDLPPQWEDTEITDEFIEADTNFLNAVTDAGMIPAWEEFLDYRKVSTDYGDGHHSG